VVWPLTKREVFHPPLSHNFCDIDNWIMLLPAVQGKSINRNYNLSDFISWLFEMIDMVNESVRIVCCTMKTDLFFKCSTWLKRYYYLRVNCKFCFVRFETSLKTAILVGHQVITITKMMFIFI